MEKIIWVAGMTRSGSMWTHNVLRNVLKVSGYNVLPKHVPETNEEITHLIRNRVLLDIDPNNIYTFKTHANLDPLIPKSYVITTIRDVRDALISWMNFMKSDFKTALAQAEGMTRISNHFLKFPDQKHYRIRYEDIIADPESTIKKLCRRISINIPDQSIREIASNHEKNKIKKLIKKRETIFNQKNKAGELPNGFKVVPGCNESERVYDRQTGFQSGHVTDYKDGDWQTILSPDQITAMHDRLSLWLKDNDYL